MAILKKLLTLLGALVLIFFILTGASYLLFGGIHRDKVAVLRISGVIRDTTELTKAMDALGERSDVKAVVLRINSPGGAVGPSQELYSAVKRLDAKKAVVASMGSVAASGGYYAASAARRIVANPGTLTGSIGVIVKFITAEDLLHKIGLKGYVVKSGKFKDAGSPMRAMTAEEKALLQNLVNDINAQFISAVAKGRGMKVNEVRKLADGRVFTGAQAKKNGLVDELGDLTRAITLSAGLGGIKGKPYVIYPEENLFGQWEGKLSESFSGRLSGLFPGLHLMYIMPGQ
jgi:protease-4